MKKTIVTLLSSVLLLAFSPFATAKTGVLINRTDGGSTFIPEELFESIDFLNNYNGQDNTPNTPPTTLPPLEDDFITVENGTFINDVYPSATTDEELQGVSLSDQVMSGATNFITITTEQEVEAFYLGIEGQEGYLEYIPTELSTRSSLHVYVIPLMMSDKLNGDCILIICARLHNGKVTKHGRFPLHHLKTREGDLEVKLSFSNEKDVDIHLYTPSGIHVFYGNSGGGYFEGTVNGEYGRYEFGLDIDSNAGCDIDGINKENIYIPAQFVENGEYRVEVDLYSNCDPSIPTIWSVVTRYKGELVRTTSGSNPASGEFEIGAQSSGNTVHVPVMTFNITDVDHRGTRSNIETSITHEQFMDMLPEAQKAKMNALK